MLIGFVGADPTTHTFDSGNKVVKFRLATSERFKDKNGQQQERTDWHNIEAWGNAATAFEKYVKKGDKLFIEGKIRYEEYKDKDGATRYMTVIRVDGFEFLSPKKQESDSAAPAPMPQNPYIDDLPFD